MAIESSPGYDNGAGPADSDQGSGSTRSWGSTAAHCHGPRIRCNMTFCPGGPRRRENPTARGSPAGIEQDIHDLGFIPKSTQEYDDECEFTLRDPAEHSNYFSVDGDAQENCALMILVTLPMLLVLAPQVLLRA